MKKDKIGDRWFYLGDDNGNTVDFNDEIQTFTLIFLKIWMSFTYSMGQVMTLKNYYCSV